MRKSSLLGSFVKKELRKNTRKVLKELTGQKDMRHSYKKDNNRQR